MLSDERTEELVAELGAAFLAGVTAIAEAPEALAAEVASETARLLRPVLELMRLSPAAGVRRSDVPSSFDSRFTCSTVMGQTVGQERCRNADRFKSPGDSHGRRTRSPQDHTGGMG